MDLSPDDLTISSASVTARSRARAVGRARGRPRSRGAEADGNAGRGNDDAGRRLPRPFATSRTGGTSAGGRAGVDRMVKDLLDQLPAMKAQELRSRPSFKGTLRLPLRGLQWLAFLDRSASADAWRMTWVGQEFQLIALRCMSMEGMKSARRCSLRRRRWWQLGQGGRAFRTVTSRPSPSRPAAAARRRIHQGGEKTDVVITSYALPIAIATTWRRSMASHRAGRGTEDQEPLRRRERRDPALSAPRRLALTGTPIRIICPSSGHQDLLNPGLLEAPRDFRDVSPCRSKTARSRSRRAFAPHDPPVRPGRVKTDPEIAGDLPDKIEMKVYCNLTVEQAAMYSVRRPRCSADRRRHRIRRRGLILAVLTRLKADLRPPRAVTRREGSAVDRRSGSVSVSATFRGSARGRRVRARLHPYAQMATFL